MSGRKQGASALLALGLTLAVGQEAFGYIDPGTTSSMFALLAPILSVFAVFVGYILWPFRKALWGILGHKKEREEATQPELSTKATECDESVSG